MTKKTMDGKKARWTRAQKLEAKRSSARKQRGADGGREFDRDAKRSARSDRSERFDKRAGSARAERGDDRRPRRAYDERDDRRGGSRYTDRRDDNRGSRGYRTDDRRDDRRDFRRDDRRDDRRDFRRDDRRDERRDFRRDDRRDERRDFRRDERRDDRRDFRRDDRRDFRRDDRRDFRRDERRTERPAPAYRDDKPATREPVVQEPISLDGNGFADLGLPESLVERLARDGITQPFPIQTATIPDALEGRDVLGRGRTGSGKTLSFGLPALTRLAAGGRARPNQPRAIVLVPTRELAMQVSDALQPLVHVIGLRHKLVAGGMPYEPQLSALERGVDLLIATPGRLIDLMERGAADLSRVEIAILDEADHMAEMGFLEAITQILDEVPADGQRLLFSATLDRGIDTVVERYLTDPVEHATDDGTASVSTMAHHALLIEPRDKKIVTAEVANRSGRTVVFVRTKLGADRVAAELRDQGVMAAALHGGLNQGQRNKVLSAFKDGKVPVLVATDVAARGIHVDDVGVVLQVDPPADHKDYLHRAGRTARAGEQGTVVTLALPHQRRTMQRLLDEAGVETTLQRAQPGDDVIRAAGGSTPEGRRITDDDLQRILTPPRANRGGRGGDRRGGGGYRGGRSGGYGGGYGAGRPRRDGFRSGSGRSGGYSGGSRGGRYDRRDRD
ncbi:DEAD/DEAH box helicase [Flexivirga sp. ID2601S]|uniref:DEAD/DEAH box helicase n=1 Tax=Flexivirga aerilata TaxID=1656889 RepID=A0A849APN0_9MICO|nr:DEAD/DEAH box helicase [Flexivirga aerilata]NNG40270.1 DEAD/DEAH box helicase [Flexivirga aerilata]